MKRLTHLISFRTLYISFFLASAMHAGGQDLRFALHIDPVITWMGSNSSEYLNEGVMAGVNAGLNALYYLDDNYAVSTGISFLAAGGRQSAASNHTMVFNNFTKEVDAGDEMKYNLNYVNVPVGIRLQTNQIKYLTYFTDAGFDIRMLLKATTDILARQITNENSRKEVYGINAGWHIYAGVTYELTINLSAYAALGYDQDLFDVTKDLKDVYQPEDRSGLRMLRFRFGISF